MPGSWTTVVKLPPQELLYFIVSCLRKLNEPHTISTEPTASLQLVRVVRVQSSPQITVILHTHSSGTLMEIHPADSSHPLLRRLLPMLVRTLPGAWSQLKRREWVKMWPFLKDVR
ncbi:MAG: hypothetical protein DRN99_05025 [Thermoproteota archaeon]|nr:MAG: hypothetical protein DRN99_05025 [Candidatus Korarchaeota archaeon]